MDELVKKALAQFNEIEGQIKIDQHILTFNKERTVCAIAAPEYDTVSIYTCPEGRWIKSFDYLTQTGYYVTSISLNDDCSRLAVGLVDLHNRKPGGCVLLKIYADAFQEDSFLRPINTRLSQFGQHVRLIESGKIVAIYSPDYVQSNDAPISGGIFLFERDSGEKYRYDKMVRTGWLWDQLTGNKTEVEVDKVIDVEQAQVTVLSLLTTISDIIIRKKNVSFKIEQLEVNKDGIRLTGLTFSKGE